MHHPPKCDDGIMATISVIVPLVHCAIPTVCVQLLRVPTCHLPAIDLRVPR